MDPSLLRLGKVEVQEEALGGRKDPSPPCLACKREEVSDERVFRVLILEFFQMGIFGVLIARTIFRNFSWWFKRSSPFLW